MTTQKKPSVPGRSRHPGHPLAPQATKQGISAVIADVLIRLAGAQGLSAAHRAAGQRLLKQADKWPSFSATRRAALWSRIMGLAEEAGFADPECRDIAMQSAEGNRATVDVTGPRGVHELTERMQREHGDRVHVVARKHAQTPIAQIVAEMAGRRSRAWVYRVLQRHKEFGDVADRRTIRREHPRRIPPVVSSFVESFAYRKHARPTVVDVALRVRQACEQFELPVPSESWVRQHLKDEPQLDLLRRFGPNEYRRQHRPIVVRERHILPGERYYVDSTLLDVWLQEPRPNGKLEPVRPSITLVTDVGSRAIVGYHINPRPVNESAVLKAIVHAITDTEDLPGLYGKPTSMQFDKGKEASPGLRDQVAALGIEVLETPARSPDLQGKVERAIKTITGWLGEVDGHVPVVGGTKAHARKIVGQLWSIEAFRDWLQDRVTQHNDLEIHRDLGMSRRLAWEKGAHPRALTEVELLALLPERRAVSLSRGMLQIQERSLNHRFMADFLQDLPERQVEIRFSKLAGTVHVFDPDTDRYLGPATELSPELTPEEIENVQRVRMEVRARRRELLRPVLPAGYLEELAASDGSSPPPPIAIVKSIEPAMRARENVPELEVRAERALPKEVAEDPQVARIKALRKGRAS